MKFELRLSPHLTQQEKAQLTELSQHFPQKDHMWMASSGSSQGSGDSVKLIALSQRALVASAVSVNHHLQAGPGDRWFQALPTFHVGGLGVELRAELLGLPVFPMPSKWQPQGFTQACQDSGATLGSLVPTQIFDLVREGQRAPPQLRAVIVGGGPFSRSSILRPENWDGPCCPVLA